MILTTYKKEERKLKQQIEEEEKAKDLFIKNSKIFAVIISRNKHLIESTYNCSKYFQAENSDESGVFGDLLKQRLVETFEECVKFRQLYDSHWEHIKSKVSQILGKSIDLDNKKNGGYTTLAKRKKILISNADMDNDENSASGPDEDNDWVPRKRTKRTHDDSDSGKRRKKLANDVISLRNSKSIEIFSDSEESYDDADSDYDHESEDCSYDDADSDYESEDYSE
eukprot:Pgem_evm1s690